MPGNIDQLEIKSFFCVNSLSDFSCPDPEIMSDFRYNNLRGYAEAKLYSMFKVGCGTLGATT